MNKFIIIPTITIIFLLIDWYVWQAVKISTQNIAQSSQNIVKYIFWGITALTITGMWLYNFTNPDWMGKTMRTVIMVGVFINYVSKIFVILFLLIDDLGRLGRWIISKFSGTSSQGVNSNNPVGGSGITRSEFLMKTAVIAGAVPALALTWGIISGAHDYRVRKVKLALKKPSKAI